MELSGAENDPQNQIFRKWYYKNFPEIPQEIIPVYSELISLLPMHDAYMKIPTQETSGVELTRPQLIEEMKKGTDPGKEWARFIIQETFRDLDKKGKERVEKNPQALIGKTIERLQKSIDQRKPKP